MIQKPTDRYGCLISWQKWWWNPMLSAQNYHSHALSKIRAAAYKLHSGVFITSILSDNLILVSNLATMICEKQNWKQELCWNQSTQVHAFIQSPVFMCKHQCWSKERPGLIFASSKGAGAWYIWAQVAGYCEKVAALQDRRAGLYHALEEALLRWVDWSLSCFVWI